MVSARHLIGGPLLVIAGVVTIFTPWPVPAGLSVMIGAVLCGTGLATAAIGFDRPRLSNRRREIIEGITVLSVGTLGGLIVLSHALAPQGAASVLLAILWSGATLVAVWLGISTLRDLPET